MNLNSERDAKKAPWIEDAAQDQRYSAMRNNGLYQRNITATFNAAD